MTGLTIRSARLPVTAAILVLLAAPATASEDRPASHGVLVETTGRILVSDGTRFVPARDHHAVAAGTRILVGNDAVASIAFPDCTLPLEPGKIHTVKPVPCAVEDDLASAPEGGEAPLLRNTPEQWDITASTDAIPVPVNGTYYVAPPPPPPPLQITPITTPLPGMMMAGGIMVGGTLFAFNEILEDPAPETPVSAH